MEWFSGEIGGWAAFGGLAILITVSIVRGWLIPKGTHDREMAQEKRRGDEWKESTVEARALINLLVKANEIVNDFFRKVPVQTAKPENGTEEV